MCLFLWSYFLKNSLFYRTVRIWNTENPKKNKTVIKTKNKQGEKVLRLLDYDEDYDEVFGEVCRASHFSCISPQSSAQRPTIFFTDFFWLVRRTSPKRRDYWQSIGLQCLLFVSAAKSIGSFLWNARFIATSVFTQGRRRFRRIVALVKMDG